ncbi:MAG: aspartate/glutamate racemase family protein [Alphaproteobacteria bacterium]|nr:aspartate/glutamate racemase family protein [Alphaproteobacteria bacterium]
MIGVFDSGSGGLTILEALHEHMPDQDFLYLGDHANAPYGHRSNDQIVDMTRASMEILFDAGCDLVVLACNTAAAIALRTLQQDWLPKAYPNKRILGVLVPMVEALTGVPWSQEHPDRQEQKNRSILLFATRKTVDSGSYLDEVRKRAPHVTLHQKACPGLVDAIEGGAGKAPVRGLIGGYIEEVLAACPTPEAAVLGCTHFPLVKDYFRSALPKGVELLSQPEIVAASLVDYLKRHPEFMVAGNGHIRLLTTGKPEDVTMADAYLPEKLRHFEDHRDI